MSKFKKIATTLFCLLPLCNSFADDALEEVRVYVPDINSVHQVLMGVHAKIKSRYEFVDYIYHREPEEYHLEYIRVRHNLKSSWDTKSVNVSKKVCQTRTGRAEKIYAHEYDTLEQASKNIEDGFSLSYSYARTGIEYTLKGSLLYLEDIVGLEPTVEILSKNKKEIESIFKLLGVSRKDIINVSVPFLIEAKRNSGIELENI